MAKKTDAPDAPADDKAEAKVKTAPAEGKAARPPKAKPAPEGDKAAPEQAKSAPEGAAPERPAPASQPSSSPDGSSSPKKRRAGFAPRRGKKLRNSINNSMQKIAKEGAVPVPRAISVLKSMKRAKFDETVEVHIWLGIDGAQNDQNVRGSVSLPHGLGKTVRVVVFCQGDDIAKAKEAGAEHAGAQEIIDKIQKENWLDFDVVLATQSMMGQVSRLGKVLGPRGLMPTPKAGTVVTAGQDIGAAVKEFKAGKVEFRSDKGGNVHAGVGKLSFSEDKLMGNIQAFVDQIRAVKPAGVKGHYIKKATLSATMSPGILIQI